MVKSSTEDPQIIRNEQIVNEDETEDEEEEDSRPKGSKIAELLQKPFDFISMMVQFIIYFMVRMATEGCMLPIPELEGNEGEENGEEEEEEEDKKRN